MIRIRQLKVRNFKRLQDIDLRLPERGRFLVRGRNESGKSTLFEAVYFGLFGRPLVTESNRPRTDDVITYGEEEAEVEMLVELAGRRGLHIRRTVRRDRPNAWELDILALEAVPATGGVRWEASRPEEVIRGNNPVNERIQAELGFDGDALLNSCFVEQKKLDKLEGMTPAQREVSLMKLLNLDRLVALEADLKVRTSDDSDLARAQDKARLARSAGELPQLLRRRALVTAGLARHRAARAAGHAYSAAQEVAQLETEIQSASHAEKLAEADAETLAGLQTAAAAVKRAVAAQERLDDSRKDVVRLDAAYADLTAVRDAALPAALEREKALKRLSMRLERLDCWDRRADDREAAADDRRHQLSRREELNELRRSLVAARAKHREASRDLERLEGDLRAFEVREALAAWLEEKDGLDAAREGLAAAQAFEGRLASRLWREGATLGAATLGVALGGAALRNGWPTLAMAAFGLALLLAGWLVLRVVVLGRAKAHAAQRVRQRVIDLEAERRSSEAAADRRQRATERLRELNAVVPADPERAAAVMEELDSRLDGRSRQGVRQEETSVRQHLAEAQAAVRTLGAEESELAREVGAVQPAQVAEEAAGLDRDVRRIRQMVEARRQRAATRLADLGSSPKTLTVDLDRATETRRRLRDKMAGIPALRGELDAAQTVEAERARAVAGAWDEVAAALDTGLARLDLDVPPIGSDETPDAGRLLETIRRATQAAGLEGAEQRREQRGRRVAELGGRLADARGRLADLRQEAHRSLREARAAQAEARLRPDWPAGGLVQAPLAPTEGPSTDPDAGALDALLVELLDHPLPDTVDLDGTGNDPGPPSWAPSLSQAALEELWERLQERINVTRHTVSSLEDELGVAAADVDADDAERVAESMARSLEVRRRAVEIVSVASRNVMHQVLPSTLEHMRHLLPYLTDGRYFDARLADDFRIEVWDEAAGDWRRKSIFSGGAKDQFSLALRLAFALATLPEERGAAPSFLFLDEPLGGFDPDRASALVGLLTEGAVAESFDQIFLISHVPVEEAAFDYRLVLDAGRVVESDLGA